ncbi:E3 ubiquitin protein ligase DRIP2 [Linum grandiflorum]
MEANRMVVKVRRELIAACLTCTICNRLFRDATTVSECLHTFCRKCISRRISNDGLESCPICNIDLGCVALEKLRPDHNLQDVRSKIFPFKRQKIEAPDNASEVAPDVTPEEAASVPLPMKRKERSLSSLVVSAPKVSTQTTTTGRRTKLAPRNCTAARSSSVPLEKPIKEDDHPEGCPESSSSREIESNLNTKRRQSSSAEPSQSASNTEAPNGAGPWDGKSDLWQPLNFLVEVASRTKSYKTNSQLPDLKLESIDLRGSEQSVQKTEHIEDKERSKVDENLQITTNFQKLEEPKKVHRIRRRKPTRKGISSQAVLDAASSKQERRTTPVWFSLVASDEQEGDASLPQISANYLKIKDGTVPVSFIHKYLKRKLDLLTEEEIEIKCMGEPVIPTSQLHSLVERWIQKQSSSASERMRARVGSSAEGFVMVLAYARRAAAAAAAVAIEAP